MKVLDEGKSFMKFHRISLFFVAEHHFTFQKSEICKTRRRGQGESAPPPRPQLVYVPEDALKRVEETLSSCVVKI